jgi:hypothetical protein
MDTRITNLDGLTCYTSGSYNFVNSSALNNTMYIAIKFPAGDKFQAFAAAACERDARPSQHEIALLPAVACGAHPLLLLPAASLLLRTGVRTKGTELEVRNPLMRGCAALTEGTGRRKYIPAF